MIKIKLIVLLMLFSAISNLFAKQIDAEKAHQIAESFISSVSQLRNAKSKNLSLAYTAVSEKSLKSANADVYYYVFNVNDNDGFIIVAGNDIATPILGYTTSGSYNERDLAPAFVYWMSCLQQDIALALENGELQTEKAKEQWMQYENSSATLKAAQSVGPLLKTTWGQKYPYNLLCPNQYPTGCVATAKAQIMKYYEYPKKGTGIIEAYTTETNKILVEAIDFDAFNGYDWDNMLEAYWVETTTSADITVEHQAVAELMFHCGASVNMDYTPTESGAYSIAPGKSLPDYFGYAKSLQGKSRDYYKDTEWTDFLLNELNNNRPVLYCGGTSANFHAFVCDGYDGQGLFHFNWGWDGSYDGYFATSALTPGSSSYNHNQQIIIGITPDPEQTSVKNYEMKLSSQTNLAFMQDITSVKKGEQFDIQASYLNAGVTDFTGSFGIALVQANGTNAILEVIGMYDFMDNEFGAYFYDSTLPAGYSFTNAFSIPCVVSDVVSSGDYLIKAAVKSENGEWQVIDGEIGFTDVLSLNVKDEIVADESELYLYKPDKADYANGFYVSDLKQGSSATFRFAVANGGADFLGDIELWLLSEQNEKTQLLEKGRTQITEDYYTSFLFSTPEITVAPGQYKLAVYAKAATGAQTLLPAYEQELYQNSMPVTVGDMTGVEKTDESSVRVYPNPVQETLFISNPEGNIQGVKLIDFSGRILKTISSSATEIAIPVSSLPAGIYFVVLETPDKVITQKIIKK